MTEFDEADRAAQDALRSGALGAVPTPSPDLSAWFAAPPVPGPVAHPATSRMRRVLTWLGGVGFGAKLALGAGVAVASVGIAGTAEVLPGPVQDAFDESVGRGGSPGHQPVHPDGSPTSKPSSPDRATPTPGG
jgi:hypothetical protein